MSGSVEEYLRDRLDVLKERGDGELIIKECLFCGRVGKLYVNVQKLSFNCYAASCGARGRLIALIMAIEECDSSQAAHIIGGLAAGLIRAKPTSELAKMCLALREGTLDLNEEAAASIPLPSEYRRCWDGKLWRTPKYLVEKRRLRKDTIKRWKLGYCANGHYGGRVIIPVETAGLSAFVARDITGDAFQKYLNPVTLQSLLLFGYDDLVPDLPVILVEGVFDAMRLWSYGHQAVAYFGSEMKPPQVALLHRRAIREVVAMPDNDAIQKAHGWIAKLIPEFDTVKIATLRSGDPDDAGVAEVERALAEAAPLRTGIDALASGLSHLRDPWA